MGNETVAPDAKKDLLWLLIILLFLGIIWYAAGGQSKPSATSGPFLKPTSKKQLQTEKQNPEEIIEEKPVQPPAR